MRIQFLDVASHQGLIAAVDADRVIASQDINHRITDRELVSTIENVLEQAKWKHEDLTHIACISGPGGFTSLRVGVSAANALAWALGIPSCAIHLSDLYAARVMIDELWAVREGISAQSSKLTAHSLLWIHSTKKSEVFLRGFGAYANLAPQAQWMKLDDALAILPDDIPLIGELIPEHREAVEKRGLRLRELPAVIDVLPAFLRNQSYANQMILPWYGRGI